MQVTEKNPGTRKAEPKLAGQIAVITGGTAGIGKAIAKRFAEEGATVLLLATNPERGEAASQEICHATAPGSARFIQCDVSNYNSVSSHFEAILKEFGRVDILVNNAGITRDQLLMKMSEADWDRVMEVNAKSCFNTCRAVARPMMKAQRGKIINISSVVGITGNVGQFNYAASKAALFGMTKSLAKELASRNINVNAIAPGYIETEMTGKLPDKVKDTVLESIPFKKIGQPEEIANAALFLASRDSDYITGQCLVVDGGLIL